MSEAEHGQPFEQVESPLTEPLNAFDINRGNLYLWLASVASEPPDVSEYVTETTVFIRDTSRSFSALCAAIREDSKNEAAAQELIGTFWHLDDDERVTLFGNLVDPGHETTTDFRVLSTSGLEKIIQEIYRKSDTPEELHSLLGSAYGYKLTEDVERLAEHYQTAYHMSHSQADEIGKRVEFDFNISKARRALGVAIFAAGLTLGAVLGKKFLK
jgi:hypothetical protein